MHNYQIRAVYTFPWFSGILQDTNLVNHSSRRSCIEEEWIHPRRNGGIEREEKGKRRSCSFHSSSSNSSSSSSQIGYTSCCVKSLLHGVAIKWIPPVELLSSFLFSFNHHPSKERKKERKKKRPDWNLTASLPDCTPFISRFRTLSGLFNVSLDS